MTSTILIPSSSPPQCFARSPTPVVTSSPGLPSPYNLLHPNSSRPNAPVSSTFKLNDAHHNGLTGSKATKSSLGAKVSAENVPVGSQKNKLDSQNQKVRDTRDVSGALPRSGKAKVPQTAKNLKAVTNDPEPTGQSTFNEKSQISDVASPEWRKLDQSEVQTAQNAVTVVRRHDWTPTKTTKASQGSPSSASKVSFKDLAVGFSFAGDLGKKTISFKANEQGPTKRRKLDLINSTSTVPSSKRPDVSVVPLKKTTIRRDKSPKKFTTITARATKNLMLTEEPEGLMQYFSKNGQNMVESQEPIKTNKRSGKTKRAKAKSLQARAPASPTSAIQSFQHQDLIFGTSSQLERDESPTLTRDTLKAIKESEEAIFHTPPRFPTDKSSSKLFSLQKSRNLWAAAGRDENGSLLQIDSIDLLDTPDVQKALVAPSLLPPKSRVDSISPKKMPSEGLLGLRGGWLDLEADFDITTPIAKSAQSVLQRRAIHTKARDPTDTVVKGLTDASRPSEPMRKAGSKPMASVPLTTRPSFAGLTNDQLSAKLTSYGFKPIKKRDKMIETLERCWDDQHNIPTTEHREKVFPAVLTHAEALDAIHGLTARPMPKVPKKKGRPRKDNGETFERATKAKPKARAKGLPKEQKKGKAPVEMAHPEPEPLLPVEEDIEDAATEDIHPSVPEPQPSAQVLGPTIFDRPEATDDPAPSSLSKPNIPGSELQSHPLSSTSSSSSSSTHLSASNPPSSLRPLIADPISRAILHQPSPSLSSSSSSSPSHNGINFPTFHEQILMYDPIVLEDLTLWLNVEGLGAVGDDREVGPLEVREWCESRGVCCFWKGAGGWRRGRERGSGKGR